MALKEYFKEVDPHCNLPLGTIVWKRSKFMDAYLYFIHDKSYLAYKGQSRRYNYDPSKVITNDPATLRYEIYNIDMLDLSPYADMKKL